MLENLRHTADRVFRQAAMYGYAFNQSRAKVLTDPVYTAVAKLLLRDDPPLNPKLASAKIPTNLYLSYRGTSRRLQYFIEDWDFSEAKPELLTARQRQMMHTVALGETSGSAVADGFLRAFRTNPELAAFFGTWFTEELNHFIGYHAYLERMGERWPADRGLQVAEVDFIPYAADPLEVAACNMYQELLGFLVYRQFGKQVRDPFLARMLAQFAKDECRHYKFYQQVVARRIQQDPSFRTVVLKVILKATSPYNQVSGGARNVLDHLELGAFYFRKPEYEFFLDQVEYLLGTRLQGFFDWYFSGVVQPCGTCSQPPFRCGCEHFEDEAAPPLRDPEWWKRSRDARTELDLDAWTRTLFSAAERPQRARA
jgi:hypothetical protein